MSTTYFWYSPAPDLFGNEVCQSLRHWTASLDMVITYCREHLDERVIVDEYKIVFTGRKFLELIGVMVGNGTGLALCREDGCREPATHPPHESSRTHPSHEESQCMYCSRWCAAHAEDVA